MKLPDCLEKNYDNYFFNCANALEERSIMHLSKKEYVKAFGYSLLSRLPYLADLIVSIVTIPFALLGVFFGLVTGVIMWKKETPLLDYFGGKLIEKINHLFLSLVGAVISPWLANKGKDIYQADTGINRYRGQSF